MVSKKKLVKPNILDNRFTGFKPSRPGQKLVSIPAIDAFNSLWALLEKEGDDSVTRVYALVIAQANSEKLDKLYGKPVSADNKKLECVHRLAGVKCPHARERWNCPGYLRGDHLVYRQRAFTYEPYGAVDLEDMQTIVTVCQEYGLKAEIRGNVSVHFPGETLHIAILKKEKEEEIAQGEQ